MVNRELLPLLWPPILLMFAGLLTVITLMYRQHKRNPPSETGEITINNPLQLTTAIQFGILLAVILLLAEAMKNWFGDAGIYGLSIISGLMDVDAITFVTITLSSERTLAPGSRYGNYLSLCQ